MSRESPQELAMFAQVNANQPRLLEWLNRERADTIKFLGGAVNPVLMHRSQGDLARLDKIIALLTKAGAILKKQP